MVVDQAAAGGRQGEGVDRQVAAGEVLLEAPALEGREVDGERQPAALDAPGAEGPRQAEARRPRGPGQRGRRGGGVAVDGDVEVGDAPAEQRVADPSPDRPGPRPEGPQRLHQGAQRALGRRGGAHPSWTRGMRAPIAHVTS